MKVMKERERKISPGREQGEFSGLFSLYAKQALNLFYVNAFAIYD